MDQQETYDIPYEIPPYPHYDLCPGSPNPIGYKKFSKHATEKILWCKENLDENDWDIDLLNNYLLFRTYDLYTQFVLTWGFEDNN